MFRHMQLSRYVVSENKPTEGHNEKHNDMEITK